MTQQDSFGEGINRGMYTRIFMSDKVLNKEKYICEDDPADIQLSAVIDVDEYLINDKDPNYDLNSPSKFVSAKRFVFWENFSTLRVSS